MSLESSLCWWVLYLLAFHRKRKSPLSTVLALPPLGDRDAVGKFIFGRKAASASSSCCVGLLDLSSEWDVQPHDKVRIVWVISELAMGSLPGPVGQQRAKSPVMNTGQDPHGVLLSCSEPSHRIPESLGLGKISKIIESNL